MKKINNEKIKEISYLQLGDNKDITVSVDTITKEILFDGDMEILKKIGYDTLKNILESAKEEINNGGYNYIEE